MVTQKDIINRIRSQTGSKYENKDIEVILKALVESILDATSNGEDISIPNLGKFYARFLKGKKINNAGIERLKNRQFDVPSRYNLGFSPSLSANKIVNKLFTTIEQAVAKKGI